MLRLMGSLTSKSCEIPSQREGIHSRPSVIGQASVWATFPSFYNFHLRIRPKCLPPLGVKFLSPSLFLCNTTTVGIHCRKLRKELTTAWILYNPITPAYERALGMKKIPSSQGIQGLEKLSLDS